MLGLSECVFRKKNWKLKSYPKTVCCSFNFMCMPIFFWQEVVFSHYIETVKQKSAFSKNRSMVLVDIIITSSNGWSGLYISVVDNSERGIFTVSDLYPSLRIGSNRQLVNGCR